jgi:hypothetical protein
LIGLEKYKCPLWKYDDLNLKGSFDNSGYEIDHITLSLSGQVMLEAVLPSITEHCIDQNDDMDNLQALCKMCHSVKTKKFLMNRNNNENNSDNNDSSDTLKNINQIICSTLSFTVQCTVNDNRCSVFIFALQKCNTRTTSSFCITFLQSKNEYKAT